MRAYERSHRWAMSEVGDEQWGHGSILRLEPVLPVEAPDETLA